MASCKYIDATWPEVKMQTSKGPQSPANSRNRLLTPAGQVRGSGIGRMLAADGAQVIARHLLGLFEDRAI
jgi:hypothetical protein